MAFVGNLGYIIVCVVGAVLIVGDIAGTTISVIVAFILYVRMYQSNISNTASSVGSIQPAFASAGRVFEVLDEEEIKGGGVMMKVLPPLVVYKEQGVYTDEIHEIYGF